MLEIKVEEQLMFTITLPKVDVRMTAVILV
jgi:hypothetical protein